MKLTTSALTTALLASGVLAAPNGRNLVDRIRARSEAYDSHRIDGLEIQDASNGFNVSYSKNWAGIVREHPPPSATYTGITATLRVPEVTATGNSNAMQAASAWVGIDGASGGGSILQAGVDLYVQNGVHTYDAWYEWFPKTAVDFNIPIKRNDVIVIKIDSLSPTKGVAVIENLSSGHRVTKTIDAPAPTATLTGQNAEWIVEDFQILDTLVSLADFNYVIFSGAVAHAGGQSYGLLDSSLIQLVQNNQIKSEVLVMTDSEFIVHYMSD